MAGLGGWLAGWLAGLAGWTGWTDQLTGEGSVDWEGTS